GKEVHLDLDGAVAGARVAAAALDVEAEPPRLVAPDLGLRRLAEQRADTVEDAGVGGRVRTGRAPDGRLVDMHHLVEVVQSGHPGVLARHGPRAVEATGEDLVQDVVDEGRLARAADSGDRGE